jgi:hypothetical protein
MAAARSARVAAKHRTKRKGTPPRGSNGDEYLYAMGPLGAAQVRIEREGERLRKWMLKLKGFALPSSDAVDALEEACLQVTKAVRALSRIPESWRPARGTLGMAPIEEGAMVEVRAKHQGKYEGIIDGDTSMRVLKIVGGRVIVDLGKGLKMPILRAHVVAV